MREIVAQDEPFVKTQVPVQEAMELFRERGEEDKVRLLAHRQKGTLVLYSLRGHRDYFQGYMVPSAGYLRTFALHAYPPGFMLQFPHQSNPTELSPITPYPRLFEVFEEAGHWLDRLGIRSVGALNDAIIGGRLPEVSLVAEAFHESRLARIASDIAAGRERIKIVLVAGPSASGKVSLFRLRGSSSHLGIYIKTRIFLRFLPTCLNHLFHQMDDLPSCFPPSLKRYLGSSRDAPSL
jgi:uridine kinase